MAKAGETQDRCTQYALDVVSGKITAEIGDDEFDADFNDEGAYHNGRHRVHDDPFASEGSGGAYAEQGGYRGECVAAVMPGVGDNGPALYPSSRSEGVPVEPLLRCDGDGSGNDGYQARPLECGAGEYRADAVCAVDEDDDGHAEQRQTDEDRHDRFVFAVFVARFLLFRRRGGGIDGEQDDDVGGKVRNGMDGIGKHGAAASQDSCDEFACRQQDVHEYSGQRDSVYFVRPVRFRQGCGTVRDSRYLREDCSSFHVFVPSPKQVRRHFGRITGSRTEPTRCGAH